MASEEAIAELRSLILGLDSNVMTFANKLDTFEDNFSRILVDIKSEIGQVKTEVKTAQDDIKN